MPNHHPSKQYSLILLVFFSVNYVLMGAPSIGLPVRPISHAARNFSLNSAPALQLTDYPVNPTLPPDYGYPGDQPTATEVLNETPAPYPSPETGSTDVIPSPSETVSTGTVSPAGTADNPNDIFLTENAEMGQSQATYQPSETLIPPTETPVIATVAGAISTDLPPDQSFNLDWGGFMIGFFGIVLIGGGVGWWFLRNQLH